MSDKSLFATDGDAPQGESEPTASRKFATELGELVGLRRREAAPPAEPQAAKTMTAQRSLTQNDAHVVVGKGASIIGEISNCSQVEIAGALEGKVVAEAVIVQPGGCLKGQVYSERAEVHGTIEGQVQVDDHLDIRSTGDVSGELVYGKLSVASGGRLSGTLQIVTEAHKQAYTETPSAAQAWEQPIALVEETGSV